MGRLIDADALYERLEKDSSYDLDFFDSELREIIENQPTAYDVEKVVAELEKEIQWAETHGTSADFRKGRISGLKTAIRLANDIVKRGDVDGKI